MNVYWSQKDIPALKGLSRQQREAAKKQVVFKVWRHWQVWLPFAVLISAYTVFVIFAPRFRYRFPIVIVTIVLISKVAALPFNHFLQHYLSEKDTET